MVFMRMRSSPLFVLYCCLFDKNGFSDSNPVARIRIKIMQSLYDVVYQAHLLLIEYIKEINLFFQIDCYEFWNLYIFDLSCYGYVF